MTFSRGGSGFPRRRRKTWVPKVPKVVLALLALAVWTVQRRNRLRRHPQPVWTVARQSSAPMSVVKRAVAVWLPAALSCRRHALTAERWIGSTRTWTCAAASPVATLLSCQRSIPSFGASPSAEMTSSPGKAAGATRCPTAMVARRAQRSWPLVRRRQTERIRRASGAMAASNPFEGRDLRERRTGAGALSVLQPAGGRGFAWYQGKEALRTLPPLFRVDGGRRLDVIE